MITLAIENKRGLLIEFLSGNGKLDEAISILEVFKFWVYFLKVFFLYEVLQKSIIENENVSATESAYLYIHFSVTANNNCEGEDSAGSVHPNIMGRPKTVSFGARYSNPFLS